MINRKVSGNMYWVAGTITNLITKSNVLTIDNLIRLLNKSDYTTDIKKNFLDMVLCGLPTARIIKITFSDGEIHVVNLDAGEYETYSIGISGVNIDIDEDQLFDFYLTISTIPNQWNPDIVYIVERLKSFLWNAWRPRSPNYLFKRNTKFPDVPGDILYDSNVSDTINKIMKYKQNLRGSDLLKISIRHSYIELSSPWTNVSNEYLQPLNTKGMFGLLSYLEEI
jgi:hypothetical protein